MSRPGFFWVPKRRGLALAFPALWIGLGSEAVCHAVSWFLFFSFLAVVVFPSRPLARIPPTHALTGGVAGDLVCSGQQRCGRSDENQ